MKKTITSHEKAPVVLCCAVLSHFSHVRLFVTLWTVAHQHRLSKKFSRQEYWSGLPCPPSEDLPDPGTELTSVTAPALTGEFFTTSATREAHSSSPSIIFKLTFMLAIRPAHHFHTILTICIILKKNIGFSYKCNSISILKMWISFSDASDLLC